MVRVGARQLLTLLALVLSGCGGGTSIAVAPPPRVRTDDAAVKQTIDRLADAVANDRHPMASLEAMSDLGQIMRYDGSKNTERYLPAVDPLIQLLGVGGVFRRNAMWAEDALLSIGVPAIPALLEATSAPAYHTRAAAARVLVKMKPLPKGTTAALARHCIDKDDWVRESAYQCLGKLGERAKPAIDILTEEASSTDYRRRLFARLALVRVTGEASPHVEDIASFLKRPDARKQGLAAELLGECGPIAHAACPQLLLYIQDDKSWHRRMAVRSLGKIGPESDEAVSVLINVLEEDRWEPMRADAARALGAIGPRARPAIPAITMALRKLDSAPEDRARGWGHVVDALAKIGGDDARDALEDIRTNGNPGLREAASSALEDVGGENQ